MSLAGALRARRGAAPGNVLAATEPHQVEGGWRTRRRGSLRRAFLGAARGALGGLWKKNS